MLGRFAKRRVLPALASTLLAGSTVMASAQEAAVPVADKGDTAWMLTATALVVLMTIPGLALFYGGLVRAKNMLSVLMQVFYAFSVVCVIWVLYGYSLTFTGGDFSQVIGGFSKAFLSGVGPGVNVETFSKGIVIPELAFVAFQMTFAAITPALIVGSIAERMRFPAVALFVPLWSTLVYMPIAHMVWFWGGPSAAGDPSGYLFGLGALDFAGGTVVHINAGIAGLVGALIVGKRIGYRSEAMAPHSLTMTLIGASLLWVGWFGFNAGSALEANGVGGARRHQYVRGDRRGGVELAARRGARDRPRQPARHRHGGGGRSRRGDARGRLCGPRRRSRARLGGRRRLLLLLLHGEEPLRLRRCA